MAGYGSDEGFAEYLLSNGHTLPDGSLSSAVLRQRGSVYVDGLYGARFTGVPTDGVAQERAWPRTGATAYGASIGADVIPAAVVQASYAAALYEARNPGKLAIVTTPGGQVKRRKVDVIEVEFFEGAGGAAVNATPVLTEVEGLLAPFLRVPEPSILVV